MAMLAMYNEAYASTPYAISRIIHNYLEKILYLADADFLFQECFGQVRAFHSGCKLWASSCHSVTQVKQ